MLFSLVQARPIPGVGSDRIRSCLYIGRVGSVFLCGFGFFIWVRFLGWIGFCIKNHGSFLAEFKNMARVCLLHWSSRVGIVFWVDRAGQVMWLKLKSSGVLNPPSKP